MENQLIYKPKYYQDNYFNINSLLEKFKNCKISNNKYLYLQKIYLNTTNKINWDTYQVNIRDSCHYLKFELFHDNEWFQEISIQSNFKFTKQSIEREIHSKSEYLELKNKYFIAPILKLKNICIYGIVIINEKKEELDKIISDKNRKIIFFSDIRNMNNPNEYYNIIKNIKTTTFNKKKGAGVLLPIVTLCSSFSFFVEIAFASGRADRISPLPSIITVALLAVQTTASCADPPSSSS